MADDATPLKPRRPWLAALGDLVVRPLDRFLLDRTAYRDRRTERFDVVVFEYPKDRSKYFVKRIVGLPGETIEIRDGTVLVDGVALDEPHAHLGDAGGGHTAGRDFGPEQVPENANFVLGDDRDQSYDSRFWGAVDADGVWGRVVMIYFSWGGERPRVRWERIGRVVE